MHEVRLSIRRCDEAGVLAFTCMQLKCVPLSFSGDRVYETRLMCETLCSLGDGAPGFETATCVCCVISLIWHLPIVVLNQAHGLASKYIHVCTWGISSLIREGFLSVIGCT